MDSITGCTHVSNIKPATDSDDIFVPILTTFTINGYRATTISTPDSDNFSPVTSILSVPSILYSNLTLTPQELTSNTTTDGVCPKMTHLLSNMVVNRFCIDAI